MGGARWAIGLATATAACAGGVGGRSEVDTEADTLADSTNAASDDSLGDSTDTPSSGPADDTSTTALCGDGVIEGDEDCDDGPDNDDSAGCTSACRTAECGDGLLHDGIEACDDGNTVDSDDCTSLCAAPACDDGITSGDETDVDCGGSCDPCIAGGMCSIDGDCRNQACTEGLCAPARDCKELALLHAGLPDGVYAIDPNGDAASDAVSVWCDMTTGGGGWTAIAANGDISVAETVDAGDCYPLITATSGEGCGDPTDLFADFVLTGDQQAGLSWRNLMAIAYGDGGYAEKLAFFAIDFGADQPTAEERFNGIAFVPTGITTDFGAIACTGYSIVHYARAGTYHPGYFADGKGTVFGHDSSITMNDSERRTFGFTDADDGGATGSLLGVDDYQDGWSCSDDWGPKDIRGARMVVLVR